MDRKLTLWILAGMVLGVVAGYIAHVAFADNPKNMEYAVKSFNLLSGIFLNLVKMLVAPLIMSTIVVGIAHMGDSAALGRIGFRAITWFIIASLLSIGLGLILVNLFQPGAGLNLTVGTHSVAEVGEVKKLDFFEFVLHIFPKNVSSYLHSNSR